MFEQDGYRCRMDWGWRGAYAAAQRGDILVVVDTLRFSTTAITAVHHGVALYPCTWDQDIATFAQRVNAIPCGHRNGEDSRFTLSPLSYLTVEPGMRVALASPNGATCARYALDVPALLIGTLINADAVAAYLSNLLETSDLNVTVLACGERWQTPSEDGALRFAVEDYIGAGAILANLTQTRSPEAILCAGAFQAVTRSDGSSDLEALLLECGSGRELQARGQTADVRHAAQLNLYDTVPIMRDECLVSVADAGPPIL